MDINRSRTRPRPQQKTLDGFFVQSPQAGPRQVGGFGRPAGFHTAPRRNLQPAGHATEPSRPFNGSLGQPVRPAAKPKAAAASHIGSRALAAQFDQPGTKSRRGLFGRRKSAKTLKPVSKFRTIRKWAFRTTAFTLIIGLVAGGFLFGKGYLKLKKVFNGTSSAAALQTDVDPTLLKGEGDGRINILLLGIGGADHDGGDLTDTIMIASVDPVNNQAILFSIPRDLWVKMPNNFIANYQKLNAAYESGKYKYLGKVDGSNQNKQAVEAGFSAVDSTIERVMGVPIHYNALINFQAFRQAIDTVGGVSIDAPEQLYDPTMAWENENSPILAKKGVNNFDGKHALNYVRSRETSSDFARSQRQRAVMLALKDKVMGLGTLTNPVKLSNLLNAFGDNVQTDISLNDMSRLAAIAKKIPSASIQSVGLADGDNNFLTTGNINGLSVVQPRAGLEDYTAIQTFVRSKLKDGYITQENANVTVLNGTFTPGLATEKADELKSYGYNVGTIDNAPTTDYDKTVIVDFTGGKKKYTLNYLKNRYHVTTISKQLPAGIVQGTADIVIILGTDATATANQQ